MLLCVADTGKICKQLPCTHAISCDLQGGANNGWGDTATASNSREPNQANGSSSKYGGSQGSSGSRRGSHVSDKEAAAADYMQSLRPPPASSIKVTHHHLPLKHTSQTQHLCACNSYYLSQQPSCCTNPPECLLPCTHKKQGGRDKLYYTYYPQELSSSSSPAAAVPERLLPCTNQDHTDCRLTCRQFGSIRFKPGGRSNYWTTAAAGLLGGNNSQGVWCERLYPWPRL